MDCLEFRRIVLADPRRLGAEVATHASQCVACREFRAHTLELEDALAAALRIETPHDLPARLLDGTARVRHPRRWLALAASLLLAVALILLLGVPRDDALALKAIDFVVFDEAQAVVVAKPQDVRVLEEVSRKMHVSLPDALGAIHYVCVYPFAGGGAHHLLVETPLGKVTVLLMPESPYASSASAAARGLHAAILPTAAGSVAIIGESSRSIERVESLLKSRLTPAMLPYRHTAFMKRASRTSQRERRSSARARCEQRWRWQCRRSVSSRQKQQCSHL